MSISAFSDYYFFIIALPPFHFQTFYVCMGKETGLGVIPTALVYCHPDLEGGRSATGRGRGSSRAAAHCVRVC